MGDGVAGGGIEEMQIAYASLEMKLPGAGR